MRETSKKSPVSIQEQLIRAERDYQQSLEKDKEFSILKALRNVINDLKSRLEARKPIKKR